MLTAIAWTFSQLLLALAANQGVNYGSVDLRIGNGRRRISASHMRLNPTFAGFGTLYRTGRELVAVAAPDAMRSLA